MFCVVYTWDVAPEHEAAFQAAWSKLTGLIQAHCGGLGSRLHRGEGGRMVAYAQWPSRETWEQSSLKTPEADALRAEMARTGTRAVPPLLLEMVEDLLVKV